MLTANDGVGHCVQYVKPADFKERYDDDSRIGVTYPFAFLIGYGGEEVRCESDEVREALGVVTAASVHALQYNFAQGSPSDALRHTRMAAVAVALGYNGEVNFTNVFSALSELEEPPKTCEEIYPGASETTLDIEVKNHVAIACYDVALSNPTTIDMDKLYTHCVRQFELGRFVARNDAWNWGWYRGNGGSLGLPIYGDELEPGLHPWTNPPGYNDTAPWDAKVRIMTGMRYGWAAFATVPVILLTAFLMVDCVFFLIVEITLGERIGANADAIDGAGGDERSMLYGMMMIYATTRAMRAERFFFTALGWLSILLFRIIFSWAPWRFGKLLPRPVCNSGSGWQTDENAATLEYTTLWILLFVIISLPLSKTEMFSINHMSAFRGHDGDDVSLNVTPDARRTRRFVGIAVLGLLVAILGQAAVAILFGYEWANALTVPSVDGVKYTDEDAWAETVYAMSLGALALAFSGGIAIASILGRWLFSGRSWCSCITLMIWLALTACSLIPLLAYNGLSLDRDEFNEECKLAFPGDDDDTEAKRGRCELRFWAFIGGFVVIFAPLVAMIIYCLFRNSTTFCLARARGGVDKDDPIYVEERGEIQKGEVLEDASIVQTDRSARYDNLPLLRMKPLTPRSHM